MTCQEFSLLMPEDWQAGEAARHAEACGECARLAARTRQLRAGLRAAAAATEGGAPARVEAGLRAAFRAQHRPAPAAVRKPGPKVWRWAAPLAAALLLAAIPVWRAKREAPPPAAPAPVTAVAVPPAEPSGSGSTLDRKRAAPGSAGQKRPADLSRGSTLDRERAAPETETGLQASVRPAAPPRNGGAPNRRRAEPGANSADAARRAASSGRGRTLDRKREAPEAVTVSADNSQPVPAGPAEGEFIPLPFAGGLTAAESLDVVRVRLPRSSMIRFGLPVAAERAWEPVNADVVVGQDGLARAIRFVR